MPKPSKVFILGGGISGLSAAYFLKQKGIPFQIIEHRNRLGGVIHSSFESGFLMEEGPNSYFLNEDLHQMITHIGLESEVLMAKTNKRYILRNGKVHRISPALCFSSLLSLVAKWKLVSEFFSKKEISSDSTIGVFFIKHFGKEVFEYLIEPPLMGIYGANVRHFSVKYTLPILLDWKAKGSVLRAFLRYARRQQARQIFALKRGNISLIEKLQDFLGDEYIQRSRVVSHLKPKEGGFEIHFEDSIPSYFAQKIICTLPYPEMQRILRLSFPQLNTMTDIPYAPFAQIYLAYRQADVPKHSKGFGFLVPQAESKHFLGVLWNSELFPYRAPLGYVLYTLFLSDDNIQHEAKAVKEFQKIMGIQKQAYFIKRRIWQRAFPEFYNSYGNTMQQLDDLERTNPGLYLSGNYRSGNALRHCISYQRTLIDTI